MTHEDFEKFKEIDSNLYKTYTMVKEEMESQGKKVDSCSNFCTIYLMMTFQMSSKYTPETALAEAIRCLKTGKQLINYK